MGLLLFHSIDIQCSAHQYIKLLNHICILEMLWSPLVLIGFLSFCFSSNLVFLHSYFYFSLVRCFSCFSKISFCYLFILLHRIVCFYSLLFHRIFFLGVHYLCLFVCILWYISLIFYNTYTFYIT